MEFTLQIAEGLLSARDARAAIARLPKALDPADATKLYIALRSWTWKALDQRRRDPDLREWIDLIRRCRLRTKDVPARSHQFDVLADLLAESVAVGCRLSLGEVLGRRHARDLLAAIHAEPGHAASKKRLRRSFDLEHANMWRIMNLLSGAGLVQIEREGRETRYSLTRLGMSEAIRIATSSGTIEKDNRTRLSSEHAQYINTTSEDAVVESLTRQLDSLSSLNNALDMSAKPDRSFSKSLIRVVIAADMKEDWRLPKVANENDKRSAAQYVAN